ncbi:response regulator transcription factor [Streptomyces sp. NPDC059837]|uniref:response regulator transcription factor n=1 Tax=unclassified Streptomyces TaxID=2593676 RepID=UPI0022507C60|nr:MULTISPECIES: response regulator transcription factor [unclassified Streptomyces]MCX4411021.1 response regulator transcription factor [Streptomyces sp. NBC_01764]MCX4455958.1 response regulator transcription factor [Streptomyces sp. NBC_01719]MCX4495317.1 response regulator transcription factor [Streptomyces sp. NBC_01728]MCX5186421.1 response regulator transcription factor [Streptomyces sp. NBC_00268]WSI40281.1 response regulator transcription factor [Streptomyces sp. NBC_01340]
MPQNVLLAEDDRAIRHALERALTLEGYAVTAVADGVEALAQAHRTPPDVLVLDVMMPGIDGLQVCRVLRAEGDRTPILMLTALVETADRIAGLDAGADDYVVKPFDVEEVFARLRALLRRTGLVNGTPADVPAVPSASASASKEASGQIVAAGLRMDIQARRAWRGQRELELTRTEFELLELLVRNTGIVLDHATIYDRIWGYDFGPGSKNLAVYVGYLRRKLDEPGAPALIHTVRGVGYVLRED